MSHKIKDELLGPESAAAPKPKALFGTLPALLASGGNIGLQASARGPGKSASRARQMLIAFEIALAVVLSVGASLLWFWLLSRGAASRVSAFYFLTPIFGLAFGALFLGEAFGPGDALGLMAVALGIVLVQRA